MVGVTASDFFFYFLFFYSFLSSLTIHICTLCADHHRHSTWVQAVQRLALLGSVHATPGVAGPRTPAERWVLRAWACLDQGLNFPLKMRKRFMARSHESVSCSLKLLSWWLLLSLGKDYFISSCSFLSLLLLLLRLHLSPAFPQLRFCADLSADLPPLLLALSHRSFPISPFSEYAHSSFHPHPHSLFPLLHPTLFFFFFSISSILPFQHMTDCVINEHHKPLFLLATH